MSGSNSTTNPLRENSNFGSQSRSRVRGMRGDGSRPECKAIVDNRICGETKTLSITDELKELYENRLKKLDEDIGNDAAGHSGQVQVKVNVLQNWVEDLLEQNAELVHTVEELEQEMGYRVKVLEEKLVESARACRAYMTKFHERDAELRGAAADKEDLSSKDALIKKLQAELQKLQAELQQHEGSSNKDREIAKLKEHLGLKDDQIRSLIQRIQDLRDDITKKSNAVSRFMSGKNTDAISATDQRIISTPSPASGPNKESISRTEFLRIQSELQRAEVTTISKHNDNIILAKQLEEAELFLEMALRDKERLADELLALDKRLDDKSLEVDLLVKSLADVDRSAREMQSALTAEVAEKHDMVITLRREFYQLEDQCRQYDIQTHFKDDIIKEMRKEIKGSRSRIIELERQLSDNCVNTDKNQRFSSSPQLGHNVTQTKSDQYIKNKSVESRINQEQKSPEKTVSYVYQDEATTDNLRPQITQCDLHEGAKPRSKTRVAKFHRHSIGDCTPSTRYQCGDVGGQQSVFSHGKAHHNQRSYSPPSRDVHGPGNNHFARDSAFPAEEQQALSVTNDEDTARLQENLRRKKAELEKQNEELDRLRGELRAKDDIIQSLKSRMQDRPTQISSQQLVSSQDARRSSKEQAEKHINDLRKAEQQQRESEKRINELQNALQHAQDNMQVSLKNLEQSNSGIKEAKDFQSKAEDGQSAYNEMKAEMDILLNNLHSPERNIQELEAIIENLHISLEKTQKQLIQVQNNANQYLKEREESYRNEEQAREKIAELQARIEGTANDTHKSWAELNSEGSRKITFAPLAMALSDYENHDKKEIATNEMKDKMYSLVKDLKARDAEVANLAETIEKLQAELLSTQSSLRESQKKEVTTLGEKRRAQEETKTKSLELEGALKLARSGNNQPQDKPTTLDSERRPAVVRNVSFHSVAGPSDDSYAPEKAKAEKYCNSKSSNKTISSDMNELRLNTVEASAAVEDMMEEMESLLKNMKAREKQISELENMIASLQKTLAQYERQTAQLKEKTQVIEREKLTSELNLKQREKKIQELQEALNSAQMNMKKSFDKLVTSKQLSDAQEYEAKAREGQLAMDKMSEEMKNVIRAVQSREKQLATKEEIIRSLQQSLEQTRAEVASIQNKASTYLKEKETAEERRKESERKLEKLQAELENAQDELRKKLEQFNSYQLESEKEVSSRILPVMSRKSSAQPDRNVARSDTADLEKDRKLSELATALARSREEIQNLQDKIKVYELQISQKPSNKLISPRKSVVHAATSCQGNDEDATKTLIKNLKKEVDDLIVELEQRDNQNAAQEEMIGLLRQQLAKAQQDVIRLQNSAETYATNLDQVMDDQVELQKLQNRLTSLEVDLKRARQQVAAQDETIQSQKKTITDLQLSLGQGPSRRNAIVEDERMVDKGISRQDFEGKLQAAKEMEVVGSKTLLAPKDMQIDALENEIKELRYNLQQCMAETASTKHNLQEVKEKEGFSVKGAVDSEIKSQLEEKNRKINSLEDELNTLRNNFRQSKIDADNVRQDIKLAEERAITQGRSILDAECVAKLREKDKQIDNLDEEIIKLRSSLKHAKMDLAELKEELEMKEERAHSGKNSMADPEVQAKFLQKDNKIDTLEEELRALRQSLKASNFELSNLREDLKMAQEKEKAHGKPLEVVSSGGKCRDKVARIEELSEEVESFQNNVQKYKSELHEKDKTIERLEEELISLRHTFKNSNLELSNLKQDLQSIEERGTMSAKSVKEADLKRLLDEKRDEVNALDLQLDTARNAEINYKKEINRLKQDLKALEDKKPSHHGMDDAKLKSREKDSRIEELEAEVNSVSNSTKKCKLELQEKDKTIERLEEELSSLRHNLKYSNLELSNLKQDLQIIEEREKVPGRRRPTLETDLKQLLNEKQEEMDALERELGNARNAEHHYKNEINRLNQELKVFEDDAKMQHGTDDAALSRLRKHLEEKNNQIENQEEEMNLLRNTLANYKREIAELKRALSEAEKETIPELQREIEASRERFMSKGEAVGFLQGTLDTTQTELHQLQLEIERMLRDKDKSQTEILGLHSELDKAKRDAQRNQELMNTVEDQQKRLNNCQEELSRAQAEIQSLQSALRAKEKLLADQEQMAAIQKDTIKRSQDEFNELKEKVHQLEAKKKDCDQEKDKLKDEINSLQAQLRDKDRDLSDLQRKNDQLQSELQDYQQRAEAEIQQMLANIEQLQNLLAESQADADAMAEALAQAQAEADELAEAHAQAQAQADELLQAQAMLEEELRNTPMDEELRNQVDSLQNENDYQREELQILQNDLMENQAQLDQLAKKHKAALNRNMELEQDISNLLGDVNDLRHELELSNVQLEAKQSEADDIRNMLDTLQGSHNVLEGLVQKKEAEMDALLNVNADLQDELDRMRNEKQLQDIQNINLTELLKDADKKLNQAEDAYRKAVENNRKNQAEAANREKQMRKEFANREKDILGKLCVASSEAQQLSDAVNMLNGEVENLQTLLADRENHLLATENELDAIGQSLLKLKADAKKRNEAMKRLHEVAEQYRRELEEKNAAINELLADNDLLSQQLCDMRNTMQGELDYIRKENDATDTEKANLTYMLEDAQTKIDQLEKDFHQAADDYKKSSAALLEAVKREAQLKQKFVDMEKNLLDRLQAADLKAQQLSDALLKKIQAMKEMKAVKEQLARELEKRSATLQNQSLEIVDLKCQLSNVHNNMTKDLESLQNKNQALDAENVNLSAMLEDAMKEAKNSEKGYHKAMEASQRNQDTLIEAANREAQLEREFAEKEKDLLDLLHGEKLEAQQLSDTVQNQIEAIKELNDSNQQLARQLEQLQAELQNTNAEGANLKSQLMKMNHRVKELITENGPLVSENANLKELLKQAEEKAQQIEMSLHNAMQNIQSNQAALLEAATQEGRLRQEFADKEREYLNQLGDTNLEAQQLTNDVLNKSETIETLTAREQQLASQIKEQETALTNQATEIAHLKCQLSQACQQMKDKFLSLVSKSRSLDSENVNLAEMLKEAENEAKQSEMGYHEAMEAYKRNQDALIEAANREMQLQLQFAEKEKELLVELEGANFQIERLTDDVQSRTEAIKLMQSREGELANQLEEKDAALNNQYAEVDHLRLQLEQVQERLLKSALNNKISKLKHAAGENREQLALLQQQLQQSLEAQSLLKQTICKLEFEISNLSKNLCKSTQVAEDLEYKCSCVQGELNQFVGNQETLEQDKQSLEKLNDALESEKAILSQAMCKLSQDYQQQLNAIRTNEKLLEETISVLEDRNTQLSNELAFLRDAFEDLHRNYLATSNSVSSLKCKLSEANTNRKDELKNICMESRALVDNVRQWINQQISDNTKLCNLIKAKSAVNHKLSINMQNMLIKVKSLKEQNARLTQVLQSFQGSPGGNVAPRASCIEWPVVANASLGQLASSTAVSITHFYNTRDLDQESTSPDESSMGSEYPCYQPAANRSLTWATTMAESVDPKPQLLRKRQRCVRSLTRS